MAGEATKKDLENMEAKDRFWNALEYSYGKQVDKSNEDFRRAYSQASNQMLSRGMQRSSYGAQTLANLQTKGVEAANDILAQRNNAYAAQLYQIERDEAADALADKKFAANYINAILASGGTPSDDLLKRAGLSRADFNAMKPQDTGGGGWGGGGYSYGGGGGSGKTKTSTSTGGDWKSQLESLLGQAKSSVTVNAHNNPVNTSGAVVSTQDTRSRAAESAKNTINNLVTDRILKRNANGG